MNIKNTIFSALLLSGGALYGLTFEEDFKSYPDFSPAHSRWMFRGVGGEVRNGEYRFNGVALTSAEEGDIHPALTMGQLRDFPAGNALKLEADFTLGRKGFSYLDPAGKYSRAIGVAMLDRPFSRGSRDPMNLPTVRLTLDIAPDGKQSVVFGCDGVPADQVKKTVTQEKRWEKTGSYRFLLEFRSDKVSGTIVDAAGKIIFAGTLVSPEFSRLFSKAYPAFANCRFEGALTRFKADNLDSAPSVRPLPVIPAAIPDSVNATLPNGKSKSGKITPDARGFLDVGRWAGVHGSGCKAKLTYFIDAPETGVYVAGAEGDWFWKLAVNGRTIADLSIKGNGPAGENIVRLPLETGRNRIEVELGSGSGGWKFRLAPPDSRKLHAAEAGLHLYGADKVCWNLDRIADDFTNLKRWGITVPGVEGELLKVRREIPASLGAWEADRYDAALDRFYEAVYNGYRLLQLRDRVRELEGLSAITGKSFDSNRFISLEKQLNEAVQNANFRVAESVCAEAQSLLDHALAQQDNWREGVSYGRNFGRFGWLTGDQVGAYASGDGLLANQLLSNGALLRQYISAPDGKTWRLNFRFAGARNAKKAGQLDRLPTVGSNVEIEFGYDPMNFYSGATPGAVAVKEINWIHKRFAYGSGFVADMSLASPALLLESSLDTLELEQPSTAPFTHMGYRDSEGRIVSLPLSEGVLYDAAEDGSLGRNWICFWSDRNQEVDLSGHRGTVPLQVIFQYQPEKVTLENGKLHIKTGKNGALWLNTPFGARLQPAGNWWGDLPPSAAGRCDVHGEMALAYPVGMREYYRPGDDGRVEIVNQFEFRRFDENDWKLKPREYAPVPPVLALMAEQNFDVKLPENLVDLGYPTIYGPLLAAPGAQLRYTLPVPDVPHIAIPRNVAADPQESAHLLRVGKHRIEGARFRAFCENIARSWTTLLYQPDFLMKSWQYLPEDFREYLTGIFGHESRYIQSYRNERFWRSLCEPYSGAKYFYSFSINCRQPGDVGVFGDRGYGIAHHFLILERMIAWSGNRALLQELWRDSSPLAPESAIRNGDRLTLDKMHGYLKNVHDWAWMDAGSNDAGDNGPVVDCGQAVFGGHAAYWRMARLLDDRAGLARASYYLSKSQLAEIARPAFTRYGQENGVLGPDHLNAGFREFITPNSYASSPMIGKSVRNEYDGSLDSLFCYAAQDGFEIFFPYIRYVWPDLRRYENLRGLYWPNRDRGRDALHGHLYSRLAYLLMDGTPQSQVREMLKRWAKASVFYIADPAYTEIMPLAMTGGCPVTLGDWGPLAMPDFTFDPARKSADLKFRKVPADYTFRASSSIRPREIRVNGKTLGETLWNHVPESYRLDVTLPEGEEVVVSILFDRIDEDRFAPFPVPPHDKTVPPAPGIEPEDFRFAPEKKVRKPENRKTAMELYRADFSGSATVGGAPAGRWHFHRWSNCKAEPSGGLTGDYPAAGIPARALEVHAVKADFAGRVSPQIKLPAKFEKLVLRGTVTASKEYAGNRPKMFFWTTKPFFFDLPDVKGGEKRNFRIELSKQTLGDASGVILQLLSAFDPKKAAEPAGSIYFQDVVLECEIL